MFFYKTIALMLPILIQSIAGGSKLNYSTSSQQEQSTGRYGFLYSRWDREVVAPASENDISNSRDPSSSHRSQQDYVCGRAVANKKYKDLLLRDQSYQISAARTKYRPIEIRMPRIIGGDETDPGEFPWTVSVKLSGQPICGGSLIDKSWILTAAHCVVGYNPKNITVRLGAYRIKDISETQTVDLPVSMFIVHKEYSVPRPFSNDIALLKLNEPVQFTDYIIPICLPTEDQLTTSASNTIVNDYSNRLENMRGALEGDSGGIVISTKMSDNDIAKCFNRLEQNYLNSIGLGVLAEVTTEQAPQHSSTTFSPSSNNLFPYGGLLEPIFNNNKDQTFNNKITFIQQQKPPIQSFEPPFAVDTNSINTYNQNNYIYYGSPWNRIGEDYSKIDSRRETVKLSRLPISKELLREIQSVGSGPMPTLNLGIQQGDFVAMASDLTQGSSSSHRDKIINLGNEHLIRTTMDEEIDDTTKYSGLSGIVVGWGWIRELDGEDQINSKGYPSVTLQKVKLPILRNNVCEAWFQSQAKKITLLPSQFCAGFNSGGKDACRGDSGGPMIIEDNSDSGRYKLIGIVSAGIGCARPSLPGLYTRVASFLTWINAQLVRY